MFGAMNISPIQLGNNMIISNEANNPAGIQSRLSNGLDRDSIHRLHSMRQIMAGSMVAQA